MILAAIDEDCLDEVLVIAAALSVPDPRDRPFDKADSADFHHGRFKDDQSDFISVVKLWDYFHDRQEHLSRSQFRKLCREEFLSYVRLREWSEVHRQLRGIVAEIVRDGSALRRRRRGRSVRNQTKPKS
jgi:ATP-dependent helicase HrpA